MHHSKWHEASRVILLPVDQFTANRRTKEAGWSPRRGLRQNTKTVFSVVFEQTCEFLCVSSDCISVADCELCGHRRCFASSMPNCSTLDRKPPSCGTGTPPRAGLDSEPGRSHVGREPQKEFGSSARDIHLEIYQKNSSSFVAHGEPN